MAPNVTNATRLTDNETFADEPVTATKEPDEPVTATKEPDELPEKMLEEIITDEKSFLGKYFRTKLIWLNIVAISTLHAVALYALVTFPFSESKMTMLWGTLMGQLAGFGVTAGVHRLWTHRAYKAKLPLRIILAGCYALAGQNTIYDWVRDHRVHHKFSETDADPHNSNRGFFFAHMGWLMMKKHPEVIRRGRKIDMSDILDDPVVAFCQKYFIPLKLLICFYLPTAIPVYLWNEKWYRSIMAQVFIRYVMSLNFTWCVNSAAHMWGNKPYDKRILPAENRLVAFLAMGEGWHNYHHVFPWDYKAAELGNYSLNTTTMLIDMFAKIGWAYDLKEPSKDLVQKIVVNNGDGSHPHWHEVPEPKSE